MEDDVVCTSICLVVVHFNPRPPCGGRPQVFNRIAKPFRISIHVLRVEDDLLTKGITRSHGYFNPRPPCGGRLSTPSCDPTWPEFQSTSSVWRTTCPNYADNGSHQFQSTSSVWRTTSERATAVRLSRYFNPRPPCGGRLLHPALASPDGLFQSTSSVWRTTLVL